MKIYVVTRGEYDDDYHIITATTNKELAEKIAEKFSDDYWGECRIEEYKNAEMYLRPLWEILFDSDGSVIKSWECTMVSEFDKSDITVFDTGEMDVIVEANSREAAIKIAAEKRAKYLAEKHGL